MTPTLNLERPQLPQCEYCNRFFNPHDPESEHGEYHEMREAMHAEGFRRFDWERFDAYHSHPYIFCSQECEQDAHEETEIGIREFRRQLEEGEIEDTPSLDPPWWAYR